MTRRGPRPAQARLRRLLIMLPWLMERGSADMGEMAATFHLTVDQLLKDLELATLCGLPPFVDELVDLWFDDEGMVHVGVPRLFTRPLRLTAPEAFTVVTALQAALALPGADPTGALGRAEQKLRAVLGDDAAVAVDLEPPPLLAVVQQAAAAGAWLSVRYWSASRDELTDRRIAPHVVFHDRGNWYVVADDDRSGEERRFRVDRIEAAAPTGSSFTPRAVERPGDDWFGPDDGQPVVLRVTPAAAWVTERYPVLETEELADGGQRVTLSVVSERWLERLLLRLGPEATVESPASWRDLGARTAARVLARYAG